METSHTQKYNVYTAVYLHKYIQRHGGVPRGGGAGGLVGANFKKKTRPK